MKAVTSTTTLDSTKGFSLVEMLSALLVIAVGIIGIAALYSDSLQAGPTSAPHAQAAALAEHIAERIRSNAGARVGYISSIGVICGSETPAAQSVDAAAQEAACWEKEVEDKLPSGLGTISRDTSTTPATFVIAVSWSAPETGAASYVIRLAPDETQRAAAASVATKPAA
jgi:type IV pilus assembly protein PilV